MRRFQVGCPISKKQKVLKVRNYEGETIEVRLYKRVPDRCSAVRQICIRCRATRIYKQDSRYESKVCRDCEKTPQNATARSDGARRPRKGDFETGV